MSAQRIGARPAPPPLPELRQEVVLALSERPQDHHRARVSRLSAEEILLVLNVEARDRLHPGDVLATTIQYPAPRGLVRLEGRATVVTHDLVRFHLEGAVDVLQRRDFVRVQVVRPLALATVADDGTLGSWIDTLTANVSGNGLLAAGPDTLSAGDAVRFRIHVTEGQPPIEGRGHVARLTDGGQRAIAIDELDGDGHQRMIRFIFECERIARQRTRDGEL
jgi:hypothetical protein